MSPLSSCVFLYNRLDDFSVIVENNLDSLKVEEQLQYKQDQTEPKDKFHYNNFTILKNCCGHVVLPVDNKKYCSTHLA